MENIGDVFVEPVSFNEMANFPAVNIFNGREIYRNATLGGHVSGRMIKHLNIILEVYLKNVNDIETERKKIGADIEKLFMNNRSLLGTVSDCMIERITPFGYEDTKDEGGINVQLGIDYHHAILNPNGRDMSMSAPATADMPSSVSVSIEEELRAAFVYNLQQITTAGGYNYDLSVDNQPREPDEIVNFPYGNIVEQPVDVENYTNKGLQGYLMNKEMKLSIDLYHNDVNNPNLAQEKMLWDLEKRLMNYPHIPNSSGYRTAVECMLQENQAFNVEDNSPITGISAKLSVYYRQNILNPSTTK
jgi:hypothetical protein